jgi:hypothetical protein
MKWEKKIHSKEKSDEKYFFFHTRYEKLCENVSFSEPVAAYRHSPLNMLRKVIHSHPRNRCRDEKSLSFIETVHVISNEDETLPHLFISLRFTTACLVILLNCLAWLTKSRSRFSLIFIFKLKVIFLRDWKIAELQCKRLDVNSKIDIEVKYFKYFWECTQVKNILNNNKDRSALDRLIERFRR